MILTHLNNLFFSFLLQLPVLDYVYFKFIAMSQNNQLKILTHCRVTMYTGIFRHFLIIVGNLVLHDHKINFRMRS